MPTKNHQNNNNAVVSSEKCVLCLNKFGTTVDNAKVVQHEFSDDGVSRTSFMTKYGLPEDALVCTSCVDGDRGYDPVEWVLANARAVPSGELFGYVTRKDIAAQLAKTEAGLKTLSNTWDGWRNALLEAVYDKEIALDAVSTEVGRRLLFETRNGRGECALAYAVFRHEEAAVTVTRAKEGFKLLSEAEDLGKHGRSALFTVVRMHEKAALELVRMPGGVGRLANATTASGWSALHEAVGWHEEAMLEVMRMDGGIDLLLKTRNSDGVSAFYEGARIHEKAIVEILKMMSGIDILARETNKEGESILHGIVSEYRCNANCSYLYKVAGPAILAAMESSSSPHLLSIS